MDGSHPDGLRPDLSQLDIAAIYSTSHRALDPIISRRESRPLPEFKPRYAPARQEISPEIPDLEASQIKARLAQMDPPLAQSIVANPDALITLALTTCDQWGRPHQTTLPQLMGVLHEVNPGPRWNFILSKSLKRLASTSPSAPSSLSSEIFETYFKTQKIFPDKLEAAYYVLNGPRFRNSASLDQVLMAKAQKAEAVNRLSPFLPPANPDDWQSAITESLQVLDESHFEARGISLPLTPAEDATLRDMLDELNHSLAAYPTKIQLKPSLASLCRLDQSFDPSQDLQDRYTLCLKLALKARAIDQKLATRPVDAADQLLAQVDRNQDWPAIVDWIASAGDNLPPMCLLKKIKPQKRPAPPPKEKISGGPRIYNYLAEPIEGCRFIYTKEYTQIPRDLDPVKLKKLLDNPDFTEIPVTDIQAANRVLSELLKNPRDNSHAGERLASTMVILSQLPDSLINRTPYTSPVDKNIPPLKKFDASEQRVGVYGSTTLDETGQRVFVLTTIHKKISRD